MCKICKKENETKIVCSSLKFYQFIFKMFWILQKRILLYSTELYNQPTAPLQRGNTSPQESGIRHWSASNHKDSVLEFGRLWSTSSFPLLPGPLWSRLVVPVKVSSRSQIDLSNNLLRITILITNQPSIHKNIIWTIIEQIYADMQHAQKTSWNGQQSTRLDWIRKKKREI